MIPVRQRLLPEYFDRLIRGACTRNSMKHVAQDSSLCKPKDSGRLIRSDGQIIELRVIPLGAECEHSLLVRRVFY
jgi:hypothetical protein